MIWTIIVVLVVVLLLLVIGINMIQGHKDKLESERRAEMTLQRAIIDETEELLSYATKLPMSKLMLVALHRRNNDALRTLRSVIKDKECQRRLDDGESQLANIEKSYQEPSESQFSFPDSDKLTLQYVQALKKLRLVLRSEHTRGRVDPAAYVSEEKRLDRLQLKISVENTIKRALAAKALRQFGTAREMVEKADRILANVAQPDDYTLGRINDVARISAEIQHEMHSATDVEAKRQAESVDDLDMLFQPKKKW